MKKILIKEVELISVSANFLEKHEVKQWLGLPLWLNKDILTVDNSRIQKDYNFQFATIEETTSDLIKFYSKEKKWADRNLPSSLSDKKELELINAIKELQ